MLRKLKTEIFGQKKSSNRRESCQENFLTPDLKHLRVGKSRPNGDFSRKIFQLGVAVNNKNIEHVKMSTKLSFVKATAIFFFFALGMQISFFIFCIGNANLFIFWIGNAIFFLFFAL